MAQSIDVPIVFIKRLMFVEDIINVYHSNDENGRYRHTIDISDHYYGDPDILNI